LQVTMVLITTLLTTIRFTFFVSTLLNIADRLLLEASNYGDC
jgi:hypothetical protein